MTLNYQAKIEQIAEKESSKALLDRNRLWQIRIKAILSSLVSAQERNILFNSYMIEMLEIPEEFMQKIKSYESEEDRSETVA